MRPCAAELTELLQREWSKIQQKKVVAGMRENPTIEVALLGDSGVGKSCLISQYIYGKVNDKVTATIGKGLERARVHLHGYEYTLQIVDTGGQEIFHSLTPALIRRSQGIVLVYDVTKRHTLFEGVPKMCQFIKKNRPDNPTLILVGNKADLAESKQGKRAITKEEGEGFAQQFGIRFIETSAFSGQNVETMFEIIANEIYDNLDLSDIDVYISSGERVDISAATTSSSCRC